MEDAGVSPDQVDGLVIVEDTSTGSWWPEDEPVPADFLAAFQQTDDAMDGLARISIQWLLKNMPVLTAVKFAMTATVCMSAALAAAIQAVGDGLIHICLVLKG
jgi:hypothetical protein